MKTRTAGMTAGSTDPGQGVGDPFAAAAALLAPLVAAAVASMGDEPFTTGQFIVQVRRTRGGEPAYQHALALLAHGQQKQQRLAEHSLHGIVFPQLLRSLPDITWIGFARERPSGVEGPEIPAWWRRAPDGPPVQSSPTS